MSTTRDLTDSEKLGAEHHSKLSGSKSDITENQIETITPNGGNLIDEDAHNHELNNKYAVKGDDSDGKVVWNWKTRIAAFCLVLLYVGKWPLVAS
jgi:hypothetical protein